MINFDTNLPVLDVVINYQRKSAPHKGAKCIYYLPELFYVFSDSYTVDCLFPNNLASKSI